MAAANVPGVQFIWGSFTLLCQFEDSLFEQTNSAKAGQLGTKKAVANVLW